MDRRLLDHYNNELQHIRQMAGEFAREFPKIAGRLALDKDAKEECPDPFVERLLEGFAFLAARVQLKLDAEFPRFTQSLLETVFPQYLSPIPSMAMVRFEPDLNEAGLGKGYVVPRGTALRSMIGRGERTPCEFRTAHELKLWPLRLIEARYFTRDIAELGLTGCPPAKAAVRLRLAATANLSFKDIQLDQLPFYIRGSDELPVNLFEQIFAHGTAVVLRAVGERQAAPMILPAVHIHRMGFAENEALLPPSPRGFEGYRFLREYFAFPQRFLFFKIAGLEGVTNRVTSKQLDVILLFKEQDPHLEGRIDASCFELFCTPVINLFPKRADRISLTERFSEYQVVVDRTRPLDFEVFEVQKVTGYGTRSEEEQEFRPFYLARDADAESNAFFTVNRVPRLETDREKRQGRHSTYTGTEVFLSIVDAAAAPYRTSLRELGITALCTNRHLPIQMALPEDASHFSMELNAPVISLRCLGTPTRPIASTPSGENAWRLISHLTLNYLSLLDASGEEGASGLRELLELYVTGSDPQKRKQVSGLRTTRCVPVIRRVPTPGLVAFARGLEITVAFDEMDFVGTGCFLLGSVLERFFARYVSINSFTETVIRTQQRGQLMRWPAHLGQRPIV